MMMTYVEVKGQWRSNIVNNVLWLLKYRILQYGYQTWSEEPLMQAKNDDDLS